MGARTVAVGPQRHRGRGVAAQRVGGRDDDLAIGDGVERGDESAQLMLHETTAGTDGSTPGVARWVAAMVDRTEGWLPEIPGLASDAIPLRVLAIYHVVAGYFASAATYRSLTGRDLNSPRAIEEQIRIVSEISDALFGKLSERGAQERV